MGDIRHYQRPERVRHYQRVERDGPGSPKRIWTIDPPIEHLVLLDAKDTRNPGQAKINQLDVPFGDTVTHWAGRAPASRTITVGLDAAWIPGSTDVEDQVGFLHRLTAPGTRGKDGVARGRRVALNFGHGQDQTWWVESVEITHKERNHTGRTTVLIAELTLIEATAPAIALIPAERAAKRTG